MMKVKVNKKRKMTIKGQLKSANTGESLIVVIVKIQMQANLKGKLVRCLLHLEPAQVLKQSL